MDSGQLDHDGNFVEESSAEQLLPPDSPDIIDIVANQQVVPRVGPEYQVEIPPMITESEWLQLMWNPAETNADASHCFLMGLPIPVMWVDDKDYNNENGRIGAIKKPGDSVNKNGSSRSKRARKSQVISNKKSLKSKAIDVVSGNGKRLKLASFETAMEGKAGIDLEETRQVTDVEDVSVQVETEGNSSVCSSSCTSQSGRSMLHPSFGGVKAPKRLKNGDATIVEDGSRQVDIEGSNMVDTNWSQSYNGMLHSYFVDNEDGVNCKTPCATIAEDGSRQVETETGDDNKMLNSIDTNRSQNNNKMLHSYFGDVNTSEKLKNRVNCTRGGNLLHSETERLAEKRSGSSTQVLDITSSSVMGSSHLLASTMGQMSKSKSCCLVPGLLGDSSWTDIEVNGFLLAVYIFEKNLVQVKRFMESKEMGDLLSFYYGKFDGSDDHRRYSDCRRMMNSRKWNIGQRICTGWKQQELLTRLLPHVSEDAKSTLVEDSKAFADGRISLEDYVHSLKTVAGIPILIKAVGIGNGKDDLTILAMEPTKNNRVFPVQSEIPVGKAWSSLTSGDIIKFLTGNFRLSKARSNDIFWEAVWPRLLATGWHSEQPKDHFLYGASHQLVFLMPGIKKFSRRKLVKGDQYFDSISEVLKKVASEPVLIELEGENPIISSCKEANEREPHPVLDQNESDNHQRYCYLKPRVSICSPNPTTFTIVDTSLSSRVKSIKVRGLRVLPDETKSTSRLIIHSKESKGDSSRYSVDEPQSSDRLLKGRKKTKSRNHAKGRVDNTNSNQRMPISGSEFAKELVEDHHDQDTVLSNVGRPRAIKNQLSRRVRPGCSNVLPPPTKRRRLASCVKDESRRRKNPDLMSNSPNFSKSIPFQEKVSLGGSSAQCSLKMESSDHILQEKVYCVEMSPIKTEKPQSGPLIDLNVPGVPLYSENGEFCVMEVTNKVQNPKPHVLGASSEKYELVEPKVLSNPIDLNAAEKLPVVNPRRQSTRNRPLTIRVLEAHESGFLGPKQRRKGRRSEIQSNPVSRRSSGAHARATATSNSSTVDDKEGNEGDGVGNFNQNRIRDPVVETERKTAQALVEISEVVHHPGVQIGDDLSG